MDFLVNLAKGFIGIFQKGGENFMGLVTGILPTLIVLLTAINALIALIGEDRVTRFSQKLTGNFITRYTLFPVIAIFFLTSPMGFSFGRFVKEKEKPAFYDAAVSFVHPILGIFPHANAAELFVWTGIASGVTQLGLDIVPLAVRYFIVGIIVIFIRGVLTELLTKKLWKEDRELAVNGSVENAK